MDTILIGFLDDNIPQGHQIGNSRIIGSIKDLEHIILTKTIDMAIITISARHYVLIENIVNTLEKHGVQAEIVPDFYMYFPAKPYIDMIDDIPIINIRYVPLDNNFNKFLKRVSDLFLAIAGIIISSPILIITAIIIKLSSQVLLFINKKGLAVTGKNLIFTNSAV